MKRITMPALAALLATGVGTTALAPSSAEAQQPRQYPQVVQQQDRDLVQPPARTWEEQRLQAFGRPGMPAFERERFERERPFAERERLEARPWEREDVAPRMIHPEAREALRDVRRAALAGDMGRAEEALARAEQALAEIERPRLERALERAERALDDDDIHAARQAIWEAQQATLAPPPGRSPGVAPERWRPEWTPERVEPRIDPEARRALHEVQQALRQDDLDRAEEALAHAIEQVERPGIEQALERVEQAIEEDDVELARTAIRQMRHAVQPHRHLQPPGVGRERF